MSYLFTYFAFLLVDSLYLCQFITCLFLNKVWGDLIVFHNLLKTSFHPEHCGAKNPGLIMAYIAATLNPEILKNFPGPVRVGKKKSGSGRVAGTRQGLNFTEHKISQVNNVLSKNCMWSIFFILVQHSYVSKNGVRRRQRQIQRQ